MNFFWCAFALAQANGHALKLFTILELSIYIINTKLGYFTVYLSICSQWMSCFFFSVSIRAKNCTIYFCPMHTICTYAHICMHVSTFLVVRTYIRRFWRIDNGSFQRRVHAIYWWRFSRWLQRKRWGKKSTIPLRGCVPNRSSVQQESRQRSWI